MGEPLSLPFSGTTPIARHHSAEAARKAAEKRGEKSLQYLDLLSKVGESGITDHEASRMLGLPLSSINSIRNGCGGLVIPADGVGLSPYGRTVTKWKRR
jgi:hypothetical protein